jgi:hypothetical protein
MRTPLAIAAVLTGLVLWIAPAMAADAHRPIVTAEKDVPTGPRICLFSQNGKRAEPSPVDEVEKVEPLQPATVSASNVTARQEAATLPDVEIAQSELAPSEKASKEPQTPQVTNRVCDTDATATAPHG